jgi:hypothetical protein
VAKASTPPPRIVFRIPATALLAAALIVVCATPFAFAASGLQVVYLVPIAFALWVVRNRTTVDADKLVVRGLFTKQVLPWTDVKAIKLADRGWLRAVRSDDSEVTLPAVRTSHLGALSIISGGRVVDPGEAAEHARDKSARDESAPAEDPADADETRED